jgi:hypothetical protein
MKISTVLDHIDSGHMALPEFQRGYVWNRDQVRGLFDSLYRRHPVGGLLVWATESRSATHRGDGPLAAGVVKLPLDGQQHMTSLYGVVRGRPPRFFDGNAKALTGWSLGARFYPAVGSRRKKRNRNSRPSTPGLKAKAFPGANSPGATPIPRAAGSGPCLISRGRWVCRKS